MRAYQLIFILAFLLISCKNDSTKQAAISETAEYMEPELTITSNPKGEEIIQLLEEEAGGKNRETASILYKNNNRNYLIERNCGWYEFKQDLSESGRDEIIKMDNIEVVQFINKRPRRDLADSTKFRLTKNLKRKLFFLELPFGLNSPTVQKEFLGYEEIKEKNLAKLKIEFIEDNDDKPYLVESIFWVDEDANRIAYLAVRFGEDSEEVEFMKSVNDRVEEGILFVDYEVYRSHKNKDFSIEKMGNAYANDKLDKKSNIEYNNIQITLSEKSCD